jgi:hypothetical protein
MTFAEAVALVGAARSFGDLPGSDEPERAYRRLVKILHPDVAPAGQVPAATAAFARLSTLWRQRRPTVLKTGRHTFTVGALVAAGDLANLYDVDAGAALLKLPRRPADNDLLDAEAQALAQLVRVGDPRHRAYAPRLVESFAHLDPATGVRRTANVLERQRGFVSLDEVARAFPDGVDPRDAAWMWRRLLVALGYAHGAGLVHGAVVGEHILIHPGEHGLVLVDWCYAVRSGERVPALIARHRDRYPPEVPARGPASPGTDIHLATSTMRRLIGDRIPPRMRRFADGCMYDAPRMRPQDAWRLLAEFDELLQTLYGPRRFRAFALPAR